MNASNAFQIGFQSKKTIQREVLPPPIKLWSFSKTIEYVCNLWGSFCNSRQRYCYWHYVVPSQLLRISFLASLKRQSFSWTPCFSAIYQKIHWWWVCCVETPPKPCGRPEILATVSIYLPWINVKYLGTFLTDAAKPHSSTWIFGLKKSNYLHTSLHTHQTPQPPFIHPTKLGS